MTPGLTQTEFEFRRQRLASLIKMQAERLTGSGASSNSSHIVIVLSHPIRYMTNDIPYPFHQNQDFLYLTGIMEPDSALVMYGSDKPDQAVLFVPRRDPARELWDGPRSGKEGAAALTGLERVHSTEELGVVLKSLKGKKRTYIYMRSRFTCASVSYSFLFLLGGTIWYDSSQPCHPQLHQTHVRPLLEGGQLTKSLRPLTHSLRAIKSPAEVALMKAAGRITAQVMNL